MKITIQNKYLSANIDTFGAELVNLVKNGHNYIWKIDEKFWNKTSPVLFPIVGQLKNNSFTLNQKKYTLQRHGFARDYEFKILEKTASSVCFSLSENEQTMKLYPFQFELIINYQLIENNLNISYIVKNKSDIKMPFSIGAHPAFAINYDIKNYQILFDKKENLNTCELENGLLSEKYREIETPNNKLDLNYLLFEKDALIFKKLNSKSIIILENNKPYIKINFGDFPNLGVWTKTDAPFLCLEPWFGYSDSKNSNGDLYTKEGIQILKPNNQFETSFSIEIL